MEELTLTESEEEILNQVWDEVGEDKYSEVRTKEVA